MNFFTRKVQTLPEISKEAHATRQAAETFQLPGQVAQATVAGLGIAAATGTVVVGAPIAASALLISLFAVQILRTYGTNRELQANFIAIADETKRMYYIIKVVEEFSIAYGITPKELKLGDVNRWMGVVLNRIIKMAGPDAYDAIMKNLKLDEKNITDLNKSTAKRSSTLGQWRRLFRRTTQPAEQLRLIVRDVTILSIFFQIFMSEFQIVLMAKQNPTLRTGKMFQRFQSESLGLSEEEKAALLAEASKTITEISGDPTALERGGGTRRIRRTRKSLRTKPRKRLSRVL
jgi:hypothetical protein